MELGATSAQTRDLEKRRAVIWGPVGRLRKWFGYWLKDERPSARVAGGRELPGTERGRGLVDGSGRDTLASGASVLTFTAVTHAQRKPSLRPRRATTIAGPHAKEK